MINKKLIVILPTYNERENIKEVVSLIYKAVSDVSVVVVDDNSPDGTGKIADKLAKKHPHFYVIHRHGKRGRGLAGKEGFLFALSTGADLIIEMDADLSHNPLEIPEFLKKIDKYDLIIGSRYLKGAKVTRSWYRKLSSFLGGCYLRLVMGLPKTLTDPTSGFRLFKRKILEEIGVESLESEGPSIISEILICCQKYRIGEIPIVFNDRKRGRSKLTLRMLIISLILPLKWRLRELFSK